MTKIGLLGSSGRMGNWVTRLITEEYKKKAVLTEVMVSDVVIDFSAPAAVQALIAKRKKGNVFPALVIGSTGWTPVEIRKLLAFANEVPVLMSSNFSIGVQALLSILRSASPVLEKAGYTPVLIEKHHRHKKDSPSGTALTIQKVISDKKIQTHSIRAGEVIGDHEVTFYGQSDHLVVGHFAEDRSIFARGAIEAALWLAISQTTPGRIYSMADYFERKE